MEINFNVLIGRDVVVRRIFFFGSSTGYDNNWVGSRMCFYYYGCYYSGLL